MYSEVISFDSVGGTVPRRENIKHIIEVLKSQVALYTELCDLMLLEKEAIAIWEINKTVEIARQKESLLHKESVQEKARVLLLSQFAELNGKDNVNLSDVVNECAGSEFYEDVSALAKRLVELITKIHTENLALRMLYSTNMRLINDFFAEAGLLSQNYGSSQQKISTIQKLA